jgi:hypothetical protein
MLVTGEEVLHGLRHGELQVHEAAVAQHHHEERQAPARSAHIDRAELTPVDLRTLAGSEVELEERLAARRANLAHVIAHDGQPPCKPSFAQALEHLLRAIRVGVEPAHDQPFEWIELAGPSRRTPRLIMRALDPLGHRFGMQPECACGLRDA